MRIRPILAGKHKFGIKFAILYILMHLSVKAGFLMSWNSEFDKSVSKTPSKRKLHSVKDRVYTLFVISKSGKQNGKNDKKSVTTYYH